MGTRATMPRGRVLIIDDYRDAADSLAELVHCFGYQTCVAYEAESGLARARELRPELVLCDVGLPGAMNGYAVASQLRSDPATASIHLVALTGFASPEDRERALSVGFDAHLVKPARLEELEELLRSLAA